MIKHVVREAEQLKDLIELYYPELDEKDRKQLLRARVIKIDGRILKKEEELHLGQTVELHGEVIFPKYAPATKVVYEDDNIIVFNKQPGISTIKKSGEDSLLMIAEKHMIEKGAYSVAAKCVPMICFGLDASVGGLVIVAKNEQIYEAIIEAIRQRRIRKCYRGLVVGHPAGEKGFHDFFVQDMKNETVKVYSEQRKDSVPAVTRFEMIGKGETMSLLEIEPVTNLMHQICAQFAYHKFPIAGDERYGNKKFNKKAGIYAEALWLHKLVFEVGKNDILGYLNDKIIETEEYQFPYIGFEGETEKMETMTADL